MTTKPQVNNKKKFISTKQKRTAITLALFLSIPLSIFLIAPQPTAEKQQDTKTQLLLPIVSVVNAVPQHYQAQFKAYGEVKAMFEVQLAAEVSGRVLSLEPNFASGKIIKVGKKLLSINKVPYQQAYLAAQKSLADAQISLLTEQRTRDQAFDEWSRSGLKGEPDSPLVLNEPQLKAAVISVKQSRAAVAQAKQDLDNTQVTAPFDALIVTREVSPGSYLQIGSEIGSIYSANSIEIRMLLSDAQWQLLPAEHQLITNDTQATLSDNQGRQWLAKVLRVEGHIEADTRQRALILTVDNPLSKGIMPGLFLTANINGKMLDNMLILPASSLSQEGEIWYVDQQNRLQHFNAKPLFDDLGQIIIQAPQGIKQLQILIRPLASYKPGMEIEIKQAELKQDTKERASS